MTTVAIEPRLLNGTDAETEKRARRRFRGAMFWSGLSHAVVIALLLGLWPQPDEEPVPLPPIPVTVIQDQEGQSGAAGGGNGDTAASSASSESQQASTADPSQTAPAEAQQQQPQQAETQPTPPQPATPQTPIPPAPADALRLSPAPDAIEPPQPVQPPEPVPPRKPAPPQAKLTVAQTPPTPPAPQPATQQAAQAPAAPSTSTSGATQGADTPLPAGVGGQGRGEVGTGRAEVGNGSANGTADDYLSKLRLWILRFAKTPNDDCSREHGDGKIDVTFKRDGTVLDVQLTESSGCPASDAEALRMVHAASPLPPIPDRFPGEPKTIGLPFDFRPGLFDRIFHSH